MVGGGEKGYRVMGHVMYVAFSSSLSYRMAVKWKHAIIIIIILLKESSLIIIKLIKKPE